MNSAPDDPPPPNVWESPLQRVKRQLSEHGLSPRKNFGQNFLIDPNLAKAIASEAEADEETLVLEVGPGTGCLTRELLDSHPDARVIAVELDHGMAGLLRAEFHAELEERTLTLIEGDVLDGKHGINKEWIGKTIFCSEQEERPRRVLCANLPYNAATPLIANLALDGAGPKPSKPLVEKIIATVQLELAERLFGKPGGNDFGPLAAYLALRGSGKVIRKFGKEVFWPRPQVDSAVFVLELPPWEKSQLPAAQAVDFMAFLKEIFQARRKTLRAILKDRIPKNHPLSGMRAEDTDARKLFNLFTELSAEQPG